MQEQQKAKRFIRNDIFLILGLLAVAAVGMVYLFCFRASGNMVKVTVNGETYGTYALTQNLTKDIYTGKNGEQHNRLIIQDGKAYIETATCPDGICVAHHPVFREGESIICLPHGVVIAVISHPNSDEPDVVV